MLKYVVLFSMILVCPALNAQVPWYTVTQVGQTIAGVPAYGTGLNDSGHVSFYEAHPNFDTRGFLWNTQTGSTQIFPPPPGIGGVHPRAVSNNNTVVGSNFNSTIPGAFIWTAGSGMSSLPHYDDGLFPPGTSGQANSINNVGQAVGKDTAFLGNYRALFWNGITDPVYLGFLPGSSASSEALSINDSGTVTGWSGTVNQEKAFRWTSTEGMVPLGALPGDVYSIGHGINNAGVIAGRSHNTVSSAVRWLPGTGIEDLGNIGSDTQSVAYGINDVGEIVGMSGTSTFRAMRWSSADGMVDLNSRLVDADGWFLERAFEINESGQIIGVGSHNGQWRPFLLTPAAVPEPATILLLVAGIVGALSCWWYSRKRNRVALEAEAGCVEQS